jgi:hypothetical protein
VLARRDADAAGVSALVDVGTAPCAVWRPAARPRLVVSNPPWGARLLGGRPSGYLPEDAQASVWGQRGGQEDGHEAARRAVPGPREPRWGSREGAPAVRARPGEGRGTAASAEGAAAGGPQGWAAGHADEDLVAAWQDLGLFLKAREAPGGAALGCACPQGCYGRLGCDQGTIKTAAPTSS